MKYSIVKKSQVCEVSTLRFDAEYFEPKYLDILECIERKSKDFTTLSRFGLQIDASAFYPALEAYYNKGNLPFLRVQDINNKIDYKDCLGIPETIEEDTTFETLKFVQAGDIVITKGGSIARVGLVERKSAVCRDLIFINSSKLSHIEYKFLYVYCLSYIYKNLLIRSSSMTAQPHLTITLVRDIPIYDPDLTFKTFIAKLVDKLSNLDKLCNCSYKKAEKILLDELNIENWTPKHKLWSVKKYSDVKDSNRLDAEYFQPKYDEILKTIKDCSNGYDILGNIVDIKKGIEVGSDEYQEEGIPFVRVSNLNKFGINENNQQYISQKTYDRLALEYQPQKGEILLSKDGTAGIAYYLNEIPPQMIISGGILRLTITDSEYLPEYLTLVLNSMLVQQQIERTSSGALIQHWLINEINSTLIPKLDIQKQREIVEKIQESTKCRKQSKQFLEIAKRGVEIAIEQDENIATNWINKELQNIEVEL